MKTWFKLFNEIVGDPKMERLTSDQFRLFINLLALAARLDDDGRLPTFDDIAWMLRLRPEDVERDLQALAAVRMVTLTEGGWLVTNFAKRQVRKPSDEQEAAKERKDRWKASKKAGGGAPGGAAAPSTPDVTTSERGGNEDAGRSAIKGDAGPARSLNGGVSARRHGTPIEEEVEVEEEVEGEEEGEGEEEAEADPDADAEGTDEGPPPPPPARPASTRPPGATPDLAFGALWRLLTDERIVVSVSQVLREDVLDLWQDLPDLAAWKAGVLRAKARDAPGANWALLRYIMADRIRTGTFQRPARASSSGGGGSQRPASREGYYDPSVLAAAREADKDAWGKPGECEAKLRAMGVH